MAKRKRPKESAEDLPTRHEVSPSTAAQPLPRSFLDKRFVSGAVLIGVAYSLIVALIGRVAGKDIAGITAVALTALAIAILKEFETLQFKTASATKMITVPKPKLLDLLVVIIIFLGVARLLVIVTTSYVAARSGQLPRQDFRGILDALGWVMPLRLGTTLAVQFVAALLCERIMRDTAFLKYTYIAAGAFVAMLLRYAPDVAAVVSPASSLELSELRALLRYALLYVAAALAGAVAGHALRRRTGPGVAGA